MNPRARIAGLLAGACVLVFVLGVALGRRTTSPGANGAMNPDSVVARLTQQLQLDTTQQRAIRAVFRRHQRAVDEAWRVLAPQVRAAIDSTQMEIVNVLRPEQRTRFLKIMRSSHPGMASGLREGR